MLPLSHLAPYKPRPTLAAVPANVTPLPTSPTTPTAA